ncbi:MAG TPA: hypothetical protein VHI77_09475 [Solirubrobacterales bacterium]|jgi:hypothetical protein|nr:hypothetical protein [Solirubrobacterales bacterium]
MSEESENVVVCLDESSARAEAAQREALDPERDRYYWHGVCLEGQWIAKRYPRVDATLPGGSSWTDLFLRW